MALETDPEQPGQHLAKASDQSARVAPEILVSVCLAVLFRYVGSAGPLPFNPARSRHSESSSMPEGGSVIKSSGQAPPKRRAMTAASVHSPQITRRANH
ncbi:MAG: hypothetical protein ACRD1E_04030 [Terriglobales bacterium]